MDNVETTLQAIILQEESALDSLLKSVEVKRKRIASLKDALSVGSEDTTCDLSDKLSPSVQSNGKPNPSVPIGYSKSIPKLGGMAVADAAFYVLKHVGEPLHHKRLYQIAASNGYEAHRTSRLSLKIQSFYALVDRRPDLFRRVNGLMLLSDEAIKYDHPPRKRRATKKSDPDTPRIRKVKECLEVNGPCRRKQIEEITGLSYANVSQILLEPEFEKVGTYIWDIAGRTSKPGLASKKKKKKK